MKKIIASILALSLVLCAPAQEKKRSGWSIIPLPTVSYTSDNGWQFGALAELYYYGPGRVNFPNYDHKFYFDIGISTKGNRYGFVSYDSEKLIPGIRFSASVMYQSHKSYPFTGFNGTASPFYEDKCFIVNEKGKDEISGYYQLRKDMLRIFLDFKGDIVPGLKWAAGLNIWDIRIKDTDWSVKEGNLLHRYINAGIIKSEEAGGGFHIDFKGGLVYDTRDEEASTKKGIWSEAFFYGAPDFVQKRNSYLNLAVHFRHYVPLVKEKLTFAYHLAYQGTVLGDMPYYLMFNIMPLQLRQLDIDGLGSYTTLRGTLYNRIVGRGYAWSNMELRWFITEFKLLGINWGLAAHPLFDMGMAVQPYRLKEIVAAAQDPLYADIYSKEGWKYKDGYADKLHCCYGFGLKLAVDYNFVVSAEWAKPVLKQDGPYAISISVGYIF